MKIGFCVNDPQELRPSQTTTSLIFKALKRGHEVFAFGITKLSVDPQGDLFAPDTLRLNLPVSEPSWPPQGAQNTRLHLRDCDLVMTRTNPGRIQDAQAHAIGLEMLQHLESLQETRIINSPYGLAKAASKLYLYALPERWRPKTLVSADPTQIKAFLNDLEGPGILKPLVGTRGHGVFKVQGSSEPNLNQMMEVLLAQGHIMAQEFLPQAHEGDTRLLLFNGQLLESNGLAAAVQRVPQGSDFRSNVHVGAKPTPATRAPWWDDLVEEIGPTLRADGITFAGADIIGKKIVELNVFSAGGLGDAQKFTGVDFEDLFWERVEQHDV